MECPTVDNRIPLSEKNCFPSDDQVKIQNQFGGGKSGALVFKLDAKSRESFGAREKKGEKTFEPILKVYLNAYNTRGEMQNERPFREINAQCRLSGNPGYTELISCGKMRYSDFRDRAIQLASSEKIKKKVEKTFAHLPLKINDQTMVAWMITTTAPGTSLLELNLIQQKEKLIGTLLQLAATQTTARVVLGDGYGHYDLHPDNIFVDVNAEARAALDLSQFAKLFSQTIEKVAGTIGNEYDHPLLAGDQVDEKVKSLAKMSEAFAQYTKTVYSYVSSMLQNVKLKIQGGVDNKMLVKNIETQIWREFPLFKLSLDKDPLGKLSSAVKSKLQLMSGSIQKELAQFTVDFVTISSQKIFYPRVTMIDFDLVSTDDTGPTLPEHIAKLNSPLPITERALKFLAHWSPDPVLTAGILKVITRMTENLAPHRKGDMAHLLTYAYVFLTIYRSHNADNVINAASRTFNQFDKLSRLDKVHTILENPLTLVQTLLYDFKNAKGEFKRLMFSFTRSAANPVIESFLDNYNALRDVEKMFGNIRRRVNDLFVENGGVREYSQRMWNKKYCLKSAIFKDCDESNKVTFYGADQDNTEVVILIGSDVNDDVSGVDDEKFLDDDFDVREDGVFTLGKAASDTTDISFLIRPFHPYYFYLGSGESTIEEYKQKYEAFINKYAEFTSDKWFTLSLDRLPQIKVSVSAVAGNVKISVKERDNTSSIFSISLSREKLLENDSRCKATFKDEGWREELVNCFAESPVQSLPQSAFAADDRVEIKEITFDLDQRTLSLKMAIGHKFLFNKDFGTLLVMWLAKDYADYAGRANYLIYFLYHILKNLDAYDSFVQKLGYLTFGYWGGGEEAMTRAAKAMFEKIGGKLDIVGDKELQIRFGISDTFNITIRPQSEDQLAVSLEMIVEDGPPHACIRSLTNGSKDAQAVLDCMSTVDGLTTLLSGDESIYKLGKDVDKRTEEIRQLLSEGNVRSRIMNLYSDALGVEFQQQNARHFMNAKIYIRPLTCNSLVQEQCRSDDDFDMALLLAQIKDGTWVEAEGFKVDQAEIYMYLQSLLRIYILTEKATSDTVTKPNDSLDTFISVAFTANNNMKQDEIKKALKFEYNKTLQQCNKFFTTVEGGMQEAMLIPFRKFNRKEDVFFLENPGDPIALRAYQQKSIINRHFRDALTNLPQDEDAWKTKNAGTSEFKKKVEELQGKLSEEKDRVKSFKTTNPTDYILYDEELKYAERILDSLITVNSINCFDYQIELARRSLCEITRNGGETEKLEYNGGTCKGSRLGILACTTIEEVFRFAESIFD